MDQSTEHVREVSNTLYKYHLDNFLCDVFIVMPDGSEIQAHSVVLSAVSVKLRGAFEKSDNALKKNYAFRLFMPDCDVTTVEMVLQFVYTGTIAFQNDSPIDITKTLSAGQRLGLDANKLASFLGALLSLADASVMENLPPVILTDEDICLEIIERGQSPSSKLVPRQHPVEIIKIKSKHNEVWGTPNDGHDHCYVNDTHGQRKRGRPQKISSLSMPQIAAVAQSNTDVDGNLTSENVPPGGVVMEELHMHGDGVLEIMPDKPESAAEPRMQKEDPGCVAENAGEQLMRQLMMEVPTGVDPGGANSFEVYGALFTPSSSEIDGIGSTVSTIIKSETGIEEDEDQFLHDILLKTVSGEEQISSILSKPTTSDDPEKKKRGRKPQLIREKVIHICEFKDCGKAFRRLREYINHYRTHTGEKPYVCDLCGKAFIRSYAVTEHRRIHTGERPYQCDICGRQFSVGGDLTKHKRLHAGEVLYRCKLCGKEMNTGRENADHRRMHEGGIFCPHCSKPFTRLHNMKEHVRIAHTGDKNYVCRDCGKQFAYARNLRYHRRLHKTERPFKCHICNKSFAGAGELGRHERGTHKIQSDIQVLYVTTTAGQTEGLIISDTPVQKL